MPLFSHIVIPLSITSKGKSYHRNDLAMTFILTEMFTFRVIMASLYFYTSIVTFFVKMYILFKIEVTLDLQNYSLSLR